MRIMENLGMAAKNLRNNLVRSFLTMLGVIIGVSAVIVMVSLGEGAKQQVTNSITAMGSNLISVFPGRGDAGGGFGAGVTLTNSLLPIIQKSSPYIKDIAPEARNHFLVKAGSISMDTTVTGCTAPYLPVRNYQVAEGRFFSDEEVQVKKRVAVIGTYTAQQLFPDQDPIGQEVKIGQIRLKVIGLLAEKGQSGFGNNDDIIMVPLSTFQQRLANKRIKNRLNSIYIQAQDEQSVDPLYNQVYDVLLKEFKDEAKFNLRNQAEILNTVQQTTQSFTLLLAGIAAVSLLVGGIGIMNIMLVSVTERIREIGIRKAIGAQKEEILILFLIEAIFLSVAGGIIGIILGGSISMLMANLMGWNTSITLSSVVISFVFSIFTGLFFGVYPAYKAAGLNPIEALRHE